MTSRSGKRRFLAAVNSARTWDYMECVSQVVYEKACITYLDEHDLQGYAVCADGELKWLFSLVAGQGKQLVAEGVSRGATWLTCYDNGFLVEFYQRCGFDVTVREKSWYGDNLPDVVRMAWRQ